MKDKHMCSEIVFNLSELQTGRSDEGSDSASDIFLQESKHKSAL